MTQRSIVCSMGSEGIDAHRNRLFTSFPEAQAVDEALRNPANPTPLFYIAGSTNSDLRGCWWALGRLGPELEKQFSLAGEIVFLFSPYEDLQRRTFNALVERIPEEIRLHQLGRSGSARFTPDPNLALLWAPDPEIASKLETWNEEGAGTLVAELPGGRSSSASMRLDELRNSILRVLSSRDLYRGRNPVTGNDFFGRQDALQHLRTELYSGRSVGLFGLRRSGKTSVVREFARRYKQQRLAVVTSDLEDVGDLADIPAQMAADLTNLLRTMARTDSSVWLGSERDQSVSSFAELSSRLVRVAEKNPDYRFVLAVDEIESLVPFVNRDPEQVRRFLGSLRRAAQTVSNVALLLTGVTTRFFSESLLDEEHEVENPMFGFVDEVYLTPFRLEETSNLVRRLGRSMMLEWEDAALQLLDELTGGFPFMVRDLASKSRSISHQRAAARDDGLTVIDRTVVDEAFASWRESACDLWANIVMTLQKHHPLMAEMLRAPTAADLAEWIAIGQEGTVAARNLERLGMLVRSDPEWSPSAALVAMQRLDDGSRSSVDEVVRRRQERAETAGRVERLLGEEESSTLEFKSTVRLNVHTNNHDDAIAHAVLKTIAAFANCDGGTLLIGVSDDGGVVGVGLEMPSFQKGRDSYERFIRDKMKAALSGGAGIDQVDISFVPFQTDEVCIVDVKAASRPVWCREGDDEVLYVREGNRTLKVTGQTMMSFITRRFPA